MAKCIFCLTTDTSKFNTIEHILPESLGGGDWAILPYGLFCDNCQNKFGSTIEQQALADYPFLHLRTMLGIPTKKRKAPWMDNMHGKIISSLKPGLLELEPTIHFLKNSDKISAMLFIATSKKPDMVLRTLLKIGLEIVAMDGTNKIFQSDFDHARKYALTGEKDFPWFYIQKEKLDEMMKYFKGCTKINNISIGLKHYNNGLIMLHMNLFYISFIVPLLENVKMSEDYIPNEPEERLIIV